VLVPTNGSHEAAIAAEFGLSLLGKDATDFLVLKVVEIDKSSGQQSHVERQIEYSHEMIDQLVSDGRSRGVDARGRVIRGSDPSVEVMKVIQNDSIDVLVLGTNVRAGSSRLYLGPRVERLLRDAPCAVLLVNS
jgi:nucleotide-binding universal stress UspA family protein